VNTFGWDVVGSHVIVNLTTWQSVEALAGFVFSGRTWRSCGNAGSGSSRPPRPPRASCP